MTVTKRLCRVTYTTVAVLTQTACEICVWLSTIH